MTLAILVASTVVGVVAVIVLAGSDRTPATRQPMDPDLVPRLAAGGGCGVIVLAVSGWLIASVVVGIGCWFAVGVWQRRDRAAVSEVERTDALASWIETLIEPPVSCSTK